MAKENFSRMEFCGEDGRRAMRYGGWGLAGLPMAVQPWTGVGAAPRFPADYPGIVRKTHIGRDTSRMGNPRGNHPKNVQSMKWGNDPAVGKRLPEPPNLKTAEK